MEMIAEKMLAEIEAEKEQLKLNVLLTFFTGVGLFLGVILTLLGTSVWYSGVAFFLAYVAGGTPATISALKNVRLAKLDINLLMIIAALAAASVGAVRDGAILLFLFSLAGTLEKYAMGSTKRAVVALMKMRPDEANLLHFNQTTTRVAVENLMIGQLVLVRPGERIPIDGVIESGEGAIDQSSVTGESVPADKGPNDPVFAGTINQEAILTIKVTKLANQSTLAKMIRLVTEAQEQRSPSERFSNWFGQRYTILVLVGSALGLIVFILLGLPLATAFYKAATLLVVASPCAVVISVPAAVLSALSAAARNGVLFKGGAALEDFGNIKIIAFDKTGTLTEGKMKVTDVVTLMGDERELMKIALTLELQSQHPLANSIIAYANDLGVKAYSVTSGKAIPGKGVLAKINEMTYFAGNRKILELQGIILDNPFSEKLLKLENAGKTVIIVGRGNTVSGLIGINDTARSTALSALRSLKKAGVTQIAMLSGDTKTVANVVGKELEIEGVNIYGNLLPEDKVDIVKQLNIGGLTAFVGDGINDAAALATSSVGIAMGTAGTDVALEAADVALLSDDLSKLTATYKLAQKANLIIKQNLFFAVGIMSVMVLVTIFGYLPLPLGVIGHEGGTLLVVSNGLRLLFAYR